MSVCFRVEKNENYTVMANYHLQDRRLSLKAIGLLSKMLSLPADWDYTISGLACICQEGKDAIRSALEELEEAGYIQRRQLHDKSGAFAGNEYVIYEFPQETAEEESCDFAQEEAEQPLSENPTTVKDGAPLSGFPSTDNPLTDNPLTGNPTEQSTKVTKYLKNNPPIVPPRDRQPRKKRGPKTAPQWKPERFERFWAFYPRGDDRLGAVKAWDKLRPDDALIEKMGRALIVDISSSQWTKDSGEFIPHAATWLNRRRWEDEKRAPLIPQPVPAADDSSWIETEVI